MDGQVSVYIELVITFDNLTEKIFTMTPDVYRQLKQDLQAGRRPGSEATISINIGQGEFLLPWGKVLFAEAFLRGQPNLEQVAGSLLGSKELVA